jgi:hypothetical protein
VHPRHAIVAAMTERATAADLLLYLSRPMTPPSEDVQVAIEQGPITVADALPRTQLDRLLESWSLSSNVLSPSGQEDGRVQGQHATYLFGRVRDSKNVRFEVFVKSCSHWKAAGVSTSSAHRQRQFPSSRPGTFIRASFPRWRRSCKGAIASAATDDHAKLINIEAASRLSPEGRFR